VHPRGNSLILTLAVCVLITAVASPHVRAQQETTANSTIRPADSGGAEAVFKMSASKVVFLITRKANDIHARASGIILTADGYVATNFHAVQGADSVEIRYFPNPQDSDTYQSFNGAKLLYADRDRDVAILKVNGNALPFLDCQAAVVSAPRIGEPVFAIGNPKGLNNTISEGIVSALRSANGENVIQHTAAISPGSSGGALLDSSGDLLGMNSRLVADAQNLNFAISAEYLAEGLAVARRTAVPLNFPPDASDVAPPTGGGWGSSQAAVDALRDLARKIKECPETIELESRWGKGSQEIERFYLGPPKNVVWDEARSESVRSPYMGYIEFSVSHYFWVPKEAIDKFDRQHPGMYAGSLGMPDLKFRYEFNVGPIGLELTRALVRPATKTEWADFATRATCWDTAARREVSR
jgi:hypothetical protein